MCESSEADPFNLLNPKPSLLFLLEEKATEKVASIPWDHTKQPPSNLSVPVHEAHTGYIVLTVILTTQRMC